MAKKSAKTTKSKIAKSTIKASEKENKAKEKAKKEEDRIKKEEEKQRKIDEIIETYAQIAKQKNFVTMNDMIDAGYSKDTIVYYFRNLERLNLAARENYPDCFYDVYIDEIYTADAIHKLYESVNRYRRFVITTAVTGCEIDVDGLAAIKNYCKRKKAHHLVLVASDPAHNKFAPGADYGTIDRRLVDDPDTSIVFTDIALNSNIIISDVKLSAKHIDQTTGMPRIAANKGSFIFASPKQRMKTVPAGKHKVPYCVMTTGAITESDYSTTNYMSNRTAFLAHSDHVVGGLIVELVDDKIYHFRQFQIDPEGFFYDLGIKYMANGKIAKEHPIMVLGDIHSDSIDPVVHKCWQNIINKLGIKEIIIHDLNDAKAANPHEAKDAILRTKRAENGELMLDNNFKACSAVLNDYTKIVDKVVVVKSNHDDMVDRWLQKGEYAKDPYNHRLALDLAISLLDGNDPTKYGVERFGLKHTNKIQWLAIDDDYTVAGVQLGVHGHLGPNGSRGNIKNLEVSYGQIIHGHSHSPEILRGAWCVGTSSVLDMEYNKGASSWMHTSAFLYPNGARCLINVINGKYELDD